MTLMIIAGIAVVCIVVFVLVLAAVVTNKTAPESLSHLPAWGASLLQSIDAPELVDTPASAEAEQSAAEPLLGRTGHFPESRLVREGSQLVAEVEQFLAEQAS